MVWIGGYLWWHILVQFKAHYFFFQRAWFIKTFRHLILKVVFVFIICSSHKVHCVLFYRLFFETNYICLGSQGFYFCQTTKKFSFLSKVLWSIIILVMVNMCHLDWATRYPDIWSDILDVSEDVSGWNSHLNCRLSKVAASIM